MIQVKQTDKVAFFGGTFDPVHNGHLQIADLIINQLKFDKVIFTPNHTQLMRNQAIASPLQRLAMLKLAIDNNNKKFLINTHEIERGGLSYTIDTIEYYYNTLELKAKSPIWLILGLDAFYNLPSWHRYERLLQLCNFIIINRTLPANQNLQHELWAHDYISNQKDKFIFLDINPISISSTEIRKYLQQKNYPKAQLFIPPAVFDYIISNHLYVSSTQNSSEID